MALGDSPFLNVGGQAAQAFSGFKSFKALAKGDIAGALSGGLSNISFGGSRSVRPGFPATDPSSLKGTFLSNLSIPGGSEVSGRSFRQGATNLAQEIQFIGPILAREIKVLQSIGLGGLAADLGAEQNRLFNPVPASQAAGRAQNQQLLNLIGSSINARNDIFKTAQNDPNFSAQFEANTGTSISDFIGELQRQDKSFASGLESDVRSSRLQQQIAKANAPGLRLPGTRSASASARQKAVDDLGFKPITSKPRGQAIRTVGFRKLGERVGGRGGGRKAIDISVSEFESLKNKTLAGFDEKNFGTERRVIAGLKDFINRPGLDISAASPQFGSLFRSAAGQPGQPVQPPTQPQKPGISKGDIGRVVVKAARNFIRIPRPSRRPRSRGAGGFVSRDSFGDISELSQEADRVIPSGFISKQATSAIRSNALDRIR